MAEYEIVKFHDSDDPTKLQFPKVPLEALCESPDTVDAAPWGIPIRCVELLAMADSEHIPTATKVGQCYYNTSDHKLYTAVSVSGNARWNNGEEPPAGFLYKVVSPGSTRDTLYVKSIDEDAVTLEPLALNHMEPTNEIVQTYQGPFAVTYTHGDNKSCNCVVAGGLVFRDTNKIYQIDASVSVIAVANGESLYMRLQDRDEEPDSPLRVTYTTAQSDETGQFRVRLAYNNNGNMVQCQWGDVYTASITT